MCREGRVKSPAFLFLGVSSNCALREPYFNDRSYDGRGTAHNPTIGVAVSRDKVPVGNERTGNSGHRHAGVSLQTRLIQCLAELNGLDLTIETSACLLIAMLVIEL